MNILDDSCKIINNNNNNNKTSATITSSYRKDNNNTNIKHYHQNNNNMPDVDDANMQWFHGKITREEAESLLTPREVCVCVFVWAYDSNVQFFILFCKIECNMNEIISSLFFCLILFIGWTIFST